MGRCQLLRWGLGGVDMMELTSVPEVRIECDHPQTPMILDRVGTIVRPRFLDLLVPDPAFVLPQRRNMIKIPAHLLPKITGHAVRCIDSLRIGVVIAEHREDWTSEVGLEHAVDARLSVLRVQPRKLVQRIV